MLVLSWSYPVDEDNLVSGPGELGHGPSRLDLGSSNLDVVYVDDWDTTPAHSLRDGYYGLAI